MLKLKLELDTKLQQMWNTSVSYKSLNTDFQRKWGSICSSFLHSANFHITNGLWKHRGKILCRYFFGRSCCLPPSGRIGGYDPSSPSLGDPFQNLWNVFFEVGRNKIMEFTSHLTGAESCHGRIYETVFQNFGGEGCVFLLALVSVRLISPEWSHFKSTVPLQLLIVFPFTRNSVSVCTINYMVFLRLEHTENG